MTPPSFPPSPLQQYEDHLRSGSLWYQYSPRAGRGFFPPRVLCPFTGSDELEWREASGLGTVAATTVVHRRDELPYSVVLVDTDEGFRLMSRVDGVDPGEVTIGLRVRAQVLGTGVDETPFPVFEPAEVRS